MQKNIQQSQVDPVELDYVRAYKKRSTERKRPRMVIKIVPTNGTKPVPEWKVPDFMRHYQTLYKEKYKVEFRFNKSAWKKFSMVVKCFIVNRSLNPEQYKDFIDTLFTDICSNQFIPVPGFIVSDKLYQKYLTLKVNKKSFPKLTISRFKEAKVKLNSRAAFSNVTEKALS